MRGVAGRLRSTKHRLRQRPGNVRKAYRGLEGGRRKEIGPNRSGQSSNRRAWGRTSRHQRRAVSSRTGKATIANRATKHAEGDLRHGRADIPTTLQTNDPKL